MMGFTPADLFAGVLFGSIGIAAWQIGRRRSSGRAMFAGAALIGFQFVTPPGWPTWAVGLTLSAVAFWPSR